MPNIDARADVLTEAAWVEDLLRSCSDLISSFSRAPVARVVFFHDLLHACPEVIEVYDPEMPTQKKKSTPPFDTEGPNAENFTNNRFFHDILTQRCMLVEMRCARETF